VFFFISEVRRFSLEDGKMSKFKQFIISQCARSEQHQHSQWPFVHPWPGKLHK